MEPKSACWFMMYSTCTHTQILYDSDDKKMESAKCNSRYTLYALVMNYSAFRQNHKCLTVSIFCTFKRLQSDLSSW